MTNAETSNPFRQPESLWQVAFLVPAHVHDAAEKFFEEVALAVSGFEMEDRPDSLWNIEVLFGNKPDESNIRYILSVLADVKAIAMPEFTLTRLEQKDWVGEVQKSFPPLTVGRFFIHGSHITTPSPVSRIPLCIDAGMAFGSGEHATTSGCLLAIHRLAKRRRFFNMLDMGCGSGILALAAAKAFHAPVLAADVDRVSVRVTRDNAKRNKASHLVSCYRSDGYSAATITHHAPYDLILANILARPLCTFAVPLAAMLAENGVAVLSGLLDYQERKILSAHALQGLRLKDRIAINGWNTLILSR